MKVNNNKKIKIIGDIPLEEMEVIDRACLIEKRTRTSLIRKATVDYALKILEQNE